MELTWAGRSKFSYSGSVANGTEIVYGKGWKAYVSAEQYNDLRRHFKGLTIPVGTSRTDPPKGSLGEWLQANVSITQLASYVAPILIIEGYAICVGKHDISIIK